MYEKARSGEIKNFTGIDDPYEIPVKPEIILDTINTPIEECVKQVQAHLREKKLI